MSTRFDHAFVALEVFGKQFVNAEAPIESRRKTIPPMSPTRHHRPEPRIRYLCIRQPQPKDLRLVVEISDSSLNYDLTVKSRLYARAAIVEYWVVDVAAKQIYCHRQPIDGAYTSVSVYNQHEALSPLSAPNSSFSPGQLL